MDFPRPITVALMFAFDCTSIDRLLVIIGPCSIHAPNAALEYASLWCLEREKHQAYLEIGMRVYFEKARTMVGWKGLINDPYLDESYRIDEGLRIARDLLVRVDLLSLVMYELGHVAGLADLAGIPDIMNGEFVAGLRRLPVLRSSISYSPGTVMSEMAANAFFHFLEKDKNAFLIADQNRLNSTLTMDPLSSMGYHAFKRFIAELRAGASWQDVVIKKSTDLVSDSCATALDISQNDKNNSHQRAKEVFSKKSVPLKL